MSFTRIISLLLTFIGIIITLIAPIPLTNELKILLITAILILFIIAILSDFDKRIDDLREKQNKMEEKLNIYERLSKIESKIDLIEKRY